LAPLVSLDDESLLPLLPEGLLDPLDEPELPESEEDEEAVEVATTTEVEVALGRVLGTEESEALAEVELEEVVLEDEVLEPEARTARPQGMASPSG